MGTEDSLGLHGRFGVLMEQFEQESDRGAALVGAAYLDTLLVRLFKAKMLDEKVSGTLLEGFGPLSSLSSRISVAYCLGWIGPETHHDLDKLRKIRNKFAHAHEPVNFESSAIKTLCGDLQIPKASVPPFSKPRVQFLATVAALGIRLEFYRDTSRTAASGYDPPVPLDGGGT